MLTKALTAAAAGIIGATVIGACTAHADVPNFPDLDSYTPVDVHKYEIEIETPGMSSVQVYFLTPEGVSCGFISLSAGCSGDNLPGITGQDKNPYTYVDTSTGVQPSKSTPYVDGTVRGHKLHTLPPFHSITVDGVICGVDDKKMTACRDPQGRGFILSPEWSGWLPHV